MFIKCALAKFEWEGLPDDLTDIFVETLLLESSENNFAVVEWKGSKDETANGEFWGYFNVLEWEAKYRRPKKIFLTNGNGGSYTTSDFVLFNNFKNKATLNINYINYYSQMIAQINCALNQHIAASELIATIYAASKEEKAEIEKLFKDFRGVKVVKHDTSMLDGGKKADIVQFEIEPRLKELEELKHEIQNDLFLRLGIDAGVDKTHITDTNLKNSEQPIDLINSYELKLREDFCKRYNKWKGLEVLRVKIHNITADNSIQKGGQDNDNDGVQTDSNGSV